MYTASNSTVNTCTFTGNTARTVGGGLYNENHSTPIILNSSIICGNAPDQIIGDYTDSGENCVNQRCDECEPADKCPADLTGDGRVDGEDLTVILSSWNSCPES